MKFSEIWLREWVNPPLTRQVLADALAMAGLEVDELAEVSEPLNLGDYTFDVAITPNRGDCLSIQGIAREIAAISHTPLTPLIIPEIVPHISDTLPIEFIKDETATITAFPCSRYCGRIIKGIKPGLSVPGWLAERLRLSNIKSISPVVDVTNYVMLELGQPMHAFDLSKIAEGIQVRYAKSDNSETIVLLDESQKTLENTTLVIADHQKPLAIAGIMGGVDSSVTSETQDIFLESAYFSPEKIASMHQHYGLSSESCYRFERGIDTGIQRLAIERATQLILEIVGGHAGPVIEKSIAASSVLPITLSFSHLNNLLGIEISEAKVQSILQSLGFEVAIGSAQLTVKVPSHRSDVRLPEDVIEEVARLYGYDNIPSKKLKVELEALKTEACFDLDLLRLTFSHQGYHEIISYSFVNKALQQALSPDESALELLNPITSDMSVMRLSLWSGLISTLRFNQSRQQSRVFLFEIGTCFGEGKEVLKLGGIAAGSACREQWGLASRAVDFFDVKANLENCFKSLHFLEAVVFMPAVHPALHPGQTAEIYLDNRKIGLMGQLHPRLQQQWDLPTAVFLFELDLSIFPIQMLAPLQPVSKFPEIRRDLAILVDQAIPSQQIRDTIKSSVGAWLREVFIFDVYQGKGVASGLKSVAIGLVLQHPTRTLIDAEINGLMDELVATLKITVGAELRS